MDVLDLATLACALGSGLIAGFFFAFSVCVMRALGQQPPAQGVAAMQAINVVVLNPWFLSTFLGTAALSVLVGIAALARGHGAAATCSVAGSFLYVVGSLLVTMRRNVPRNQALAALTPSSPEAEQVWASYLTGWTAWNHVRTVASLAAAALFGAALGLAP